MVIRFVPFEKIDKNKWNGSVHYAHNSNVYGYYWYLKSVVKEWDALIEDDYTSVMPLPRFEWSAFQIKLLCGLGPYSVHVLSDKRIMAFYELWNKYCPDLSYVFNPVIADKLIKAPNLTLTSVDHYYINLNSTYEAIVEKYSREFNQIMSSVDLSNYELGSQTKPEYFLSKAKEGQSNKNILYRLFYNAIQRGTGWHSRLINNKTQKDTSAFFISDADNIYLTYYTSEDLVSMLLLLDTFIQSNAGKLGMLKIGNHKNLGEILGAESIKIIYYKRKFSGLFRKLHKIFNRLSTFMPHIRQ